MTFPRRQFALVVALTLAGQLCAVGYEIAVADRFGTSHDADALALALTLVLAVANEVVTWIGALFIPHVIDAETAAGRPTARRLFRVSAVMVVAGTAVAALLLAWGARPLVTLLAPGLASSGPALLGLFAPLLILVPLGALMASVRQAHGRFVAASLRQLCWYGTALAAVVACSAQLGPQAVPLGMVAGLAIFCGILAVRLWPDPGGDGASQPLGPRLQRLGAALAPLTIASAANYVNVTFERAIAGHLPEGSLAALTYAFRLLNFPFNLLLLNATTMLFPPLAQHAARGEHGALTALVERALRLALLFTVPLSALAIALGQPAVHLLLERGAFTSESTRLTAVALAWYAPAIIGMAGVQVLARTYQALQAIGRMVVTGLIAIGLNLVLMPLLTIVLGLRGLPLAASLTAVVLLAAMLIALKPALPEMDLGGIAASAARVMLAGIVALAVAWLVAAAPWPGPVPALASGAVGGLGAYALALAWLSREDGRLVVAFLRSGRPGKPA